MKGAKQTEDARPDARPAPPRSRELISGVMPLPAMYEFLRENLAFVEALNAARQIFADDRRSP